MSEIVANLIIFLFGISVIVYFINGVSYSVKIKRIMAYIKIFLFFLYSFVIILFLVIGPSADYSYNVVTLLFLIIFISFFYLVYNIPKMFLFFKNRHQNIYYYRDIPEKCSVGMASYLMGRFKKEEIIGATLLNIVSKKALSIQKVNNEYIFTRGTSPSTLKTDEVYLYNWYLKEEKEHFNMDEFEKIILKELNDEGLAKAKYRKLVSFFKNMFLLFIIYIIIFIICYYNVNFDKYLVENIDSLFTAGLLATIAILFASVFSGVFKVKSKKVRLTKQGRKLQNKIIGLKSFLKDFSAISIRTPEEVVLWESYLAYAVVFDMNEKYKNLDLPDVSLMNEEEREYIREKVLSCFMSE